MSRARRWWIVFAACNAVVAAALVWTTSTVVELERAGQRARAEGTHHEALRAALWRMDSWLSVFVAREAARPTDEYREWPGAVAPLFGPQAEYLSLYFEMDARGSVWSPQVAPGPLGVEDYSVADDELARRARMLERLRSYVDPETVRDRIERADVLATTKLTGPVPENVMQAVEGGADEELRSRNEYHARVACSIPPPGSRNVGRLVPIWLDAPAATDESLLVFVRKVRGDGQEESYQGFVVDWPRLRERLLFEVQDLFVRAELEPVRAEPGTGDPRGRYLANIPAALIAEGPAPAATPTLTPARVALTLAWAAALIAAVVVGATLKTSIGLAERRRRFASAVTHELRTPLTSFRLYTEMLVAHPRESSDRDPEKRRRWLETLHAEATRLSTLVENVLAHARLEQGRSARRLEPTTFEALLDRLSRSLHRAAEAGRVELALDAGEGGASPLDVDAEAIERVLCNLIDNAGKYARNGASPQVRLQAQARNGRLIFRVRDHGPGVPRDRAATIFEPFDRGGRDAADPVPGVGLGLALSRDLARDMGGELTLEHPRDGGACFRLELPARA